MQKLGGIQPPKPVYVMTAAAKKPGLFKKNPQSGVIDKDVNSLFP
jgi:hypothetical protein